MSIDWLQEVQAKDRRHNRILFSRESACLQSLLELIREQNRRTLVLWALRCAETPLAILREHCPGELRPENAVSLSWQWAAGKIKMPAAKRAILQAHEAAKEMGNPADAARCHGVAQACSTVHTEAHAIGLPVYELTAIVREKGISCCREAVEARIVEYTACLYSCAEETSRERNRAEKWAAFLLDDSRPNKEKLLYEKQLQRSRLTDGSHP